MRHMMTLTFLHHVFIRVLLIWLVILSSLLFFWFLERFSWWVQWWLRGWFRAWSFFRLYSPFIFWTSYLMGTQTYPITASINFTERTIIDPKNIRFSKYFFKLFEMATIRLTLLLWRKISMYTKCAETWKWASLESLQGFGKVLEPLWIKIFNNLTWNRIDLFLCKNPWLYEHANSRFYEGYVLVNFL